MIRHIVQTDPILPDIPHARVKHRPSVRGDVRGYGDDVRRDGSGDRWRDGIEIHHQSPRPMLPRHRIEEQGMHPEAAHKRDGDPRQFPKFHFHNQSSSTRSHRPFSSSRLRGGPFVWRRTHGPSPAPGLSFQLRHDSVQIRLTGTDGIRGTHGALEDGQSRAPVRLTPCVHRTDPKSRAWRRTPSQFHQPRTNLDRHQRSRSRRHAIHDDDAQTSIYSNQRQRRGYPLPDPESLKRLLQLGNRPPQNP